MKREDLKELGLNDEQIEAVMKQSGLDFKSKDDEIRSLKESLKSLGDENASLISEKEGFKSKLNDYDELEKNYNSLDSKLRDLRLTNALNSYDPKNVETLKRLINVDELEFNDDEIKGLDDKINALKESDSYLFNVVDDKKDNDDATRGMKSHKPEGSSGDVDPIDAQIEAIFDN